MLRNYCELKPRRA